MPHATSVCLSYKWISFAVSITYVAGHISDMSQTQPTLSQLYFCTSLFASCFCSLTRPFSMIESWPFMAQYICTYTMHMRSVRFNRFARRRRHTQCTYFVHIIDFLFAANCAYEYLCKCIRTAEPFAAQAAQNRFPFFFSLRLHTFVSMGHTNTYNRRFNRFCDQCSTFSFSFSFTFTWTMAIISNRIIFTT